jgi:hypothetical protein
MRMRRGPLLGGLALLVLVILALMQWRHDVAVAPGTLLKLAPAQVTRIRIDIPGQLPQAYVRRDGHWWSNDARPARADDKRLHALAALAATPVKRWREAANLDLHTLGLKPPQIRVRLNGQALEYGVLTPFQPDRYVKVGSRIAVIAAQDSPRVAPAKAASMSSDP